MVIYIIIVFPLFDILSHVFSMADCSGLFHYCVWNNVSLLDCFPVDHMYKYVCTTHKDWHQGRVHKWGGGKGGMSPFNPSPSLGIYVA